MKMRHILLAAASLAVLGSCATPRDRAAPPARQPDPPEVQRPVLQPRPAQPALPWADAPLSPGDWVHEGSEARFGPVGRPSFVVRCAAPGRIALIRTGASAAGSMLIRTSSASRTLPAGGAADAVEARLAASDPFLDAMLYSRGRFSVEVGGAERLVVPTWPEPARVVEDCRG
jgi:hypothetical protein